MKSRLRHRASAFVKGVVRRQTEQLFPNREAREYERWIRERVKTRDTIYQNALEPGLLAVLTPVWNGSPVGPLRALAKSLTSQNPHGTCEWVLLDNGCSNPALLSLFEELSAHTWITSPRVKHNLGIVRGLRECLERASARYVLPVDADDCLYPDALKVVTSYVRDRAYPPLLYSDEDKVIGTRHYQPYLKSDWDPVLLLNSAYIAHLGVIDRDIALNLKAYTDENTEGSPDWDLFVRFMMAGYEPVHIPEVLYSWRVHAHSTADDVASKAYIHSSQKAVLQRFLDSHSHGSRFQVECSPLLKGAAHWRFVRQHVSPRHIVSIVLGSGQGSLDSSSDPRCLLETARRAAQADGLVHFRGEDLQVEDDEWPWEALGIFELHPDAVMIGGRIRNRNGLISDAGRYFGFGKACGCPDRGRSFLDPGYFALMFKQRSVSMVSIQFAVMKAAFLAELLHGLPQGASLPFLGAWAGTLARRTARRVVYTPFLSGVSDLDWETVVNPVERNLFVEMNRDIIPDHRFYSRDLSLVEGYALQTIGAGGRS
ncbi:MAG: glycosyltransferase [Acidobacteriaceae bacterium]|nr:glycosyltransferase [Acidobacteriaceae bacterium]